MVTIYPYPKYVISEEKLLNGVCWNYSSKGTEGYVLEEQQVWNLFLIKQIVVPSLTRTFCTFIPHLDSHGLALPSLKKERKRKNVEKKGLLSTPGSISHKWLPKKVTVKWIGEIPSVQWPIFHKQQKWLCHYHQISAPHVSHWHIGHIGLRNLGACSLSIAQNLAESLV